MATSNPQVLHEEGSEETTGSTSAQDMTNYRELAVELRVTNVSGSSPTLDVSVEHSYDSVNWQTLKSFSQKTTTGDDFIYIPDGSSVYGFMRYVRATYTIGGSSPNFTFEISIVGKE